MIQPAAEAFLEACGARKPLPLEVAHRGRGVIVRQLMPTPFALIGSDEYADLRLNGKEVSHRHAYLQMVAGRWWWVDLGSRSGTHPEGRTVSKMPLLDRQGIRIGAYTVRLAPLTRSLSAPDAGTPDKAESAALTNPLATDSDDPSLLRRLALEFSGGADRLRTWKMDRVLALIGRSPICKVRLHSPLVSRVHCALVNTPSGLWIVDLLGREGTYVNGIPVRWARLDPDDEMQIDQFRIRVRYSSPPKHADNATPRGQPANAEHRLTPRANASQVSVEHSPSSSSLPSIPNEAWKREEAEGSLPPQVIAPVGVAVPMNGSDAMLMPLVAQFSLMQQQMFEQFQQTLLMMAQMFGNLQREQMALIRQELDQIQELTRQLHELQSEKPRPAPPPLSAVPQAPSVASPCDRPTPPAAKSEPSPVPAQFTEGDVHAWLSQRLAALQQERQSRWQKVLSLITGK